MGGPHLPRVHRYGAFFNQFFIFSISIFPAPYAIISVVSRIPIHNLSLNYEASGQGTSVLCLHGWASSAQMWQRTDQRLAPNYRVIRLDLPGFGDSNRLAPGFDFSMRSYAAVVRAFLREVSPKPAIVVAHSMGCLVALQLTLDAPDLVQGLVLCNPVVSGRIGPGLDVFVRWRLGQRVLRVSQQSHALARLGQQAFFANVRYFRGVAVQRNVVDLSRAAPEAIIGCLHAILQTNLSPHLSEIQAPTLLITGVHDRTVPVAEARLAARRIPGAHLAIVPRASHLPMDEQPILFDRLLEGFLARYAPAPTFEAS